MTTEIIMCVTEAKKSIPFRKSLYDNCAPLGDEHDRCIFREIVGGKSMGEIVGAKSMGEGYNRGVSEAIPDGTDCFIFTHQDVTMWAGRKLWDAMTATAMREDVGFVGVAGSDGLGPDGSWWNPTRVSDRAEDIDLLGHAVSRSKGSFCTNNKFGAVAHCNMGLTYMTTFGPYGEARVMDGVFLACKRSVLEKIGPWPEDLGWHFYDIWATEQAARKGLKNIVVPLPLLHTSIGEIRGDWMTSRDLYLKKYA